MKIVHKTVIYGAPGTGKTTKLINLIIEELKTNEPCEISYLTFTKKAANDLRKRICKVSNLNYKDMTNFGTIHSACFKLLKLDRKKVIGRNSKDFADFCNEYRYGFSSVTFNDEELVGDITNITEEANIMLDIYSRARILYPLRKDKYEHFFHKFGRGYMIILTYEEIEKFIERWSNFKKERELVDFVDMLELVLEKELIYEPTIQFYDEQQDISPLLFEVYKHFSKFAKKVYVAGDPNQSIYSFIGTKPSLFLEDEFDHSEILPKSRRVPKEIWEYSKEFLSYSSTKFYSLNEVEPCDKSGILEFHGIFDDVLVDRILNFGGDLFILCRIWGFLNKYRDILISRGIPFTMGKGNIWNDDLINISNAIYKIKSKELRLDYDEAKALIKVFNREYVSIKISDYFRKSSSDRKFSINEFMTFFKFKHHSTFLDILDSSLDLPELKLDALIKFVSKNEFISKINVYLGTIHSVKGLEADNVILDNAITEKISDRLGTKSGLDEEIRVFYVGITRAMKRLFVLENPFIYTSSFEKLSKAF